MVILITDNGRVEQRLVESAVELGSDELPTLRKSINSRVSGKSLSDVVASLSAAHDDVRLAPVEDSIFDAVADLIQANRQSRLVMTGTANLVKTESDFSGSVYPVLDAIEEQVVLLKLLSEMRGDGDTVNVSIGHEHSESVFDQTSVVSSGYVTGGELARIGLIGPTRMDYSGNIAAVRAVARYLTHLLNSPHGH
jgi:heat-inducible transcriptional repressor